MRRNRVLTILAVLLAISTAVLWLGTVLADATVVTNEGLTVAEGSANNTLSNAVLLANDPGAPGAVLTYTLVTTPANGDMFLNGVAFPLTSTATFLQTDINNNFLSYTHDGSETTSDSFDFTVETSTTITSSTFLVTVTPVNDFPILSPAGPFSILENSANTTTVGTPIVATDDDVGDVLTYAISGGNTGGAFGIASSSGQIVVANGSLLNFENSQTYSLTIQVRDIAGATDTEVVIVNLTDVNEPPTINSTTFTVDENSPNGAPVDTVFAEDPDMDSLTYTIVGGDETVFDINGTSGQITVEDGSALDFETLGTTPHFTLTVEVSDGVLTDTAEISINVNDVNEVPTVNEATFSLMENSSVGTAVGTVIASDPEGPVTFAIVGGNTSSAFAINVNTGQITVANSTPLNYEVNPTFNLTIQVTDNGLPEPIDHKTNTASITINLTDKNEAPTVNNATFSIQEDSPNGAAVGTVTATDPDTVDTLTFSIIGGNAGTAFAINPTTGQITVNDSTKLDADTMPTYNLTVQVLDKGNLPDTATVTINVDPLPITHIYLPIMLNNYPPVEPNNHCGQAYAIGNGITYEFTSDDVEDWYAFTLTSPGNLTITLSNFEPAQGQLVVYGGVCGSGLVALQNNGNSQSTKIINLGVRPAGTYYIRVYSVPVTNTTYNLRVN